MSGKKSNKAVLTGNDLVKGYTTNPMHLHIGEDYTPWRMLGFKEKDESWVRWNADWLESIGLNHVQSKGNRIIKNRRMSAGILDMEDYLYDGSEYDYLIDQLPDDGRVDPLKQFYPLAPPIINVLRGEFIKRDKDVDVYCSDSYTAQEKLDYKSEQVKEILIQNAVQLKERALQKLGISKPNEEEAQYMQEILQTASPEQKQQIQAQMQEMEQKAQQYQQEMNMAQQLAESELKFKTYKHMMEEFGQHTLNVDRRRFNMDAKEEHGFVETLINGEAVYHIDMLEDDYRVEMIDNKDSFYHMSPNIINHEDGDYFGWFQSMTIGEIIKRFGKQLDEADFKNLKEVMETFMSSHFGGGILLTEDQKTMPNAYYDTSKPYPLGRTNIPMNNARVDEYWEHLLANNFKNASVDDILNGGDVTNNKLQGLPKLFKVMRAYFRSQRKIGFLTKIGDTGLVEFNGWVDENYVVVNKPEYDLSVTKQKTKDNCIYGDHIDWTWVNEWRHVIKINANEVNAFWKNHSADFDPIYKDGKRLRFQFKGKDDVFSCYPPIVGTQFRQGGVRTVSLMDLVKPYQIIFNICMNKVPSIISKDIGKVLTINKAAMIQNRRGNEMSKDPLDDMFHNMYENKLLELNVDRELIQKIGNAGMMHPQVVDMSLTQEASVYLQLAAAQKEQVYELVGITRQRLGQQKPYELKSNVQSAVSFSEAQTEIYFNQFSTDLLPRLYQRMIEAAQYYSTINEESTIYYRNEDKHNVMLKVENMKGLLRDYNVLATNTPRDKEVKKMLSQLFLNDNTLPISALERAEVIASTTTSGILEKLRKAQAKAEQMQEARAKKEQEEQEAVRQHEKEMKMAEQEFLKTENAADRASREEIAKLRELGEIQKADMDETTYNKAMDRLLKKEELSMNNINTMKGISNRREESKQKLKNDSEKNATERLKAQKDLAVAIANQNKYDDKELNKKIAKDQKVVK